jgi:anaerobic magnesium-protoporphyrin IX monomethyl ester cyclase
MKIHLINSPVKNRAKISSLMYDNYPPLGVLYIAGYLRHYEPSLDIKVTDGLLEGWDNTLQEIRNFEPDVVCISFLTPIAISAYALANEIKGINPSIRTVMGGPHATALPAEAFERSLCDYVVIGEGEQTALELIRALGQPQGIEAVNGIVWKKGSEIVQNPVRPFIEPLDSIPYPARDLIDIKRYRGWFYIKNPPETTFTMSRGCAFNCNFCSNAVWKSSKPVLRFRSPAKIVDEMQSLKEQGFHSLFDTSDEFNNKLEHAIAICREILNRNLKIAWRTSLRAQPISEELVKLMAESGCWWVQLGIESGNQRTLDGIGKKINLDQVEHALELLNKYKIRVFGLFMLFHFWEEDGRLFSEGVDEAQKTLAYIRKLIKKKLLAYVSTNITTPYPGSPLFSIARRHDLFQKDIDNHWDRWHTDEDLLAHIPGVTKKQATKVYFQGTLIRSYCYLKSGEWRMSDVPLVFSRAARVLAMRAFGSKTV